MDDLFLQFREKIQNLPLFNSTGTTETSLRQQNSADLLVNLMTPEVKTTLQSSGLPDGVLKRLEDDRLPASVRWEELAPFYLRCCRCYPLRLWDWFVRDRLEPDGLNTANIDRTNQRYQTYRSSGEWPENLWEASGIVAACVPTWPQQKLPGRIIPLPDVEPFLHPEKAACRQCIETYSRIPIGSFDDWLKAMELSIGHFYTSGILAFSCCPLDGLLEDARWEHAQESFEALAAGNRNSDPMPLQRFMFHRTLDSMNRLGMTLRINLDSLKQRSEIIAILEHYPQLKIDVVGSFFPEEHPVHRNIYFHPGDVSIRSPRKVVVLLRRALDEFPYNKISVFHTGNLSVEMSAGAAAQTRNLLTRLFYHEIESGMLDFEQALTIADAWMYTNAAGLYSRKL